MARQNTTANVLHIYTRVSTAAQRDDGTSLQTQLEQGKTKAIQLGFGYRHWNEGGKSSHHEEIADRAKLAELYQAIKNGEVKHLFVYDQSRLSRNDNVASIFRYECNKQGVTLYTKDGQFDLANPQDKFLKQILDGLSEFDNAMRAERTRLGKLNRTRAGGWHGGPPPFGYKIVDRKLAIEKTEAQWVKRIFEESYSGKSPQKIKAILDSNGVSPRRGGIWTIGSVSALLRNSHYAGSYQFRDRKSGEAIDIICPAVVDPDVWKAVQLKRRRESSRVLQQNPTRHFYLLRDLMYCGHCGRLIAGRQRPSKNEKFYYCPNRERDWAKRGRSVMPWKRSAGCGMTRALNIDTTDQLVVEAVRETHQKSRVLREEVRVRVVAENEAIVTGNIESREALQAKIRRLEKDVARTQDLLGVLEGNHDLGKIPKKTFEAKQRVINDALDCLQTELTNRRLQLKGLDTQQHLTDWYRSYGQMVDGKTTLSNEEKKGYIAGLVERIDVSYDKKADTHQLAIRFHLPVVGDQLVWREPGRRKKGYDIVPGVRELRVTVDKPRHKNMGKAGTPEQNQTATVE